MKDMALKRRIAVLVLAALLSVAGASMTLAAMAGEAHAIAQELGVSQNQ